MPHHSDLPPPPAFARLDMARRERTGFGETVYAPGKDNDALLAILQRFQAADEPVLATRCTPEQAAYVTKQIPVTYDACSRTLVSQWGKMPPLAGRIAVCTGGTADVPVAEEAARTAEFFGAEVERFYDVGVAGIHRLFSQLEAIRKAHVVIAVAGMEGALGSVISGLVEAPVVAVPTSVGYGASFQGLAPLLAMLNTCAEGMTVVNIDNGFGAAAAACRMLRIKEKHTHEA